MDENKEVVTQATPEEVEPGTVTVSTEPEAVAAEDTTTVAEPTVQESTEAASEETVQE